MINAIFCAVMATFAFVMVWTAAESGNRFAVIAQAVFGTAQLILCGLFVKMLRK